MHGIDLFSQGDSNIKQIKISHFDIHCYYRLVKEMTTDTLQSASRDVSVLCIFKGTNPLVYWYIISNRIRPIPNLTKIKIITLLVVVVISEDLSLS